MTPEERRRLRQIQAEANRIQLHTVPRHFRRRLRRARAEGETDLAALLADSVPGRFLPERGPGDRFVRLVTPELGCVFRDPDDPVPEAERRLIILVAGRRGVMGAPVSLTLNAIGSAGTDVILLVDPANDHFRTGIPPFGAHFGEAAVRLKEVSGRYRSTVVIGNSMGGGVAAALGARIGADRALGFGPLFPFDIGRLLQGERPTAYLPYCACHRADPARVMVLCAEGQERDRHDIAAISAAMGARAVVLPGLKKHNFLGIAASVGHLDGWIGACLDLDLDPAALEARFVALAHELEGVLGDRGDGVVRPVGSLAG